MRRSSFWFLVIPSAIYIIYGGIMLWGWVSDLLTDNINDEHILLTIFWLASSTLALAIGVLGILKVKAVSDTKLLIALAAAHYISAVIVDVFVNGNLFYLLLFTPIPILYAVGAYRIENASF